MADTVFIVIAPGPLVLGVYTSEDSAHLHKRCVTGASVVECELLRSVPESIRDDVSIEWDADADEDTPVVEVRPDDFDDQ